jgi:hypothetical protein
MIASEENTLMFDSKERGFNLIVLLGGGIGKRLGQRDRQEINPNPDRGGLTGVTVPEQISVSLSSRVQIPSPAAPPVLYFYKSSGGKGLVG